MISRRRFMAGAAAGGGNAYAGTFTPAEDSRSVVIEDAIGKDNIVIFPTFDLTTEDITSRVHWGCVISNNKNILHGSTNTAKTSYSVNAVLLAGTGQLNNPDLFDKTTGSVTIQNGVDSNYGGYFVAGKTYAFVTW